MCFYLFACFKVSETQRKRRKSKPEKKGRAMTFSFILPLGEAVGGREMEGEMNCQLLSESIKSSNPAFCWGAEDVIDSEAEGFLGLS